jgi:hypothetical protein
MGPSSTLSLRHFNSTRVRHCEVELIPKSGVCTLSVFLQRSRIRSFGYQQYHIKASAVKVFPLYLMLGPLALMRFGVRPSGKAPHLIGRSQSHNQKAVLGSLPVRRPHPKHVVSRQMRAESKHSSKLTLGYWDSRDLLAGSLSSAPTGVLHQQQGEFSSCTFKCIAYWPVVNGNSHRIDPKSVLLLVVLENRAQI